MKTLEFLLEEKSMENALEILLPKILPDSYQLGVNYFLRPHNGKSDLKNSIPTKAKAFSNPQLDRALIIMMDQDSNDCKKLKKDLVSLIKTNGDVKFLVRIVCRELEGWYLGDMTAIQKFYSRFKAKQHIRKEKFRNPDECNASGELFKLIPDFQKGIASRNIPKFMDINLNGNKSFNNFKTGLTKFIEKL